MTMATEKSATTRPLATIECLSLVVSGVCIGASVTFICQILFGPWLHAF